RPLLAVRAALAATAATAPAPAAAAAAAFAGLALRLTLLDLGGALDARLRRGQRIRHRLAVPRRGHRLGAGLDDRRTRRLRRTLAFGGCRRLVLRAVARLLAAALVLAAVLRILLAAALVLARLLAALLLVAVAAAFVAAVAALLAVAAALVAAVAASIAALVAVAAAFIAVVAALAVAAAFTPLLVARLVTALRLRAAVAARIARRLGGRQRRSGFRRGLGAAAEQVLQPGPEATAAAHRLHHRGCGRRRQRGRGGRGGQQRLHRGFGRRRARRRAALVGQGGAGLGGEVLRQPVAQRTVVVLLHVIQAHAQDLVVRRQQGLVGHDGDRDQVARLQLGDRAALLVEQEGRGVHRQLRDDAAGAVLHALLLDQAQHRQGQRFDAADLAAALAAGAGDLGVLGQRGAQALARHFEQAEARQPAQLHAGAV